MNPPDESQLDGIAILSVAGRFPGAKSVQQFWQNMLNGVETISRLKEDQLEFTLSTPESKAQGQKFIGARGVLEDVDQFDAGFFGVLPREAELMDPQHRLFLECAWEALETAGYEPESFPGLIGVYAGLSINSYLLYNLCTDRGFAAKFAAQFQTENYQTLTGNDKDFLSTRVSYKLNLRGPSMSIQCACSTSLVAISQACLGLLSYQCDMALAGGVSVSFPQKRDYLYQEDGMVSADGTCRSFDAKACGTVFGHGAGIILLKRLADAVRDGDTILAVIKGTAVNNDGSIKVGYAAPSVKAQAEVIATAQAVAGVHPESISYVEAHGTGTPLGDPIEVAALTKAFRSGGAKKNAFCALGAAKPYIGHLDSAAGVTGVIKTVLQLQNEVIPPLLHFQSPNPKIDFANSPFYPVAQRVDWKRGAQPRRAGVSAFGVGGTNAHVIVEEAPLLPPSGPSRRQQLLLLSARSESALEQMASRLATHLEANPSMSLADVSYTLAKGRKTFDCRRALVVRDTADAIAQLKAKLSESKKAGAGVAGDQPSSTVFLFPGQAAQQVQMGRGLYDTEPVFRTEVDRCATALQKQLGVDLRSVLYPDAAGQAEAEKRMNETWIAQPAIFVTEYALAKLWISWGIKPALLIGHSIGEYVCAVLAETFSLEEALALLAVRAKMMQALPPGSMMGVRLGGSDLEPKLPAGLSIAAYNSANLCTVSGPTDLIKAFQTELEGRKVACKLLATSHAFHSAMMEPMVAEFTQAAARTQRNAPKIPWISTCTGRRITAEDMADPSYWARQLRQAVRFADALEAVVGDPLNVLLEVGPGQTLSQLARQHPKKHERLAVFSSLGTSSADSQDLASMLSALGKLWTAGVKPHWDGFYKGQSRRRIPLPTYPFERKRYWIEPVPSASSTAVSDDAALLKMLAGFPLLPALTEAEGLTPLGSPVPVLSDSQPVVSMSQMSPNPNVGGSRKERLAIEIKSTLVTLSGMAESDMNPSSTFMELGFDSLFLTQASQTLQKKYGVKITFRELMEDLASIDALSAFLDTKLPADSPIAAAPAVTTAVAPVSPANVGGAAPRITLDAPAGNSLLERVVAQQMAIMQQQLDLLRGAGAPANRSASAPSTAVKPASGSPAVAGSTKPKSGAHDSAADLKRFGPFKGIQIGPKGGLTPQQEKALAALTSRYNKRTALSKEYAQRHRSHFCDPRAAGNFRQQWKEMVYPIVCARSAGAKIWDIDGNEYLDVTLGFGANYFGHAPDFVVRAVEEQLHKGFEIGPQSPLAGEAADMMCAMTGMERATFCNTGSEAVMAAIRVTRTVTGRQKIVYFTGDYHGIFDEVLARAGLVEGQLGALPIAPGIPPLPHMIVLDYGSPESLEVIRSRADEIAAVLVEPVQSRHPDLQPREFLHALRKLTQEKDIALIFDEVVTGFRAAPGGAQEYFGIRADLATYGKVIGGGMPIGVLAGSRRFMDALDGGMWSFGDDSYPEVGVTFFAGTFVRHPLVMAAAHATLKYLKEAGPELQRKTTEKTQRFVKRLNDYFESVEVPIRLQTFSSVFFYDFHPDLKYASLLFYFLRDRGIHIWEGRVGQVCTSHTEEDLDRIIDAFKASVEEMQAGGFLPIKGSDASVTNVTSPAVAKGQGGPGRSSLTEAQREIWIASQMGEDANCAYNESCSLRLTGTLNVEALRKALQIFVDRHDALRSKFGPEGDYQEYLSQYTVDLPLRDLSGLTAEKKVQQVEAIIEEDMATPFHLVQGPMFRAQLVRWSAEDHQLIFTTHHAVCDGWSFGVVFHELAQLYSTIAGGGQPNLEPAMQFSQYSEWSRNQQGSPDVKKCESYWVQKFEGGPIPVLDLPYDRPRPALKTYNGSFVVRRCDPAIFKDLKKTSGQMGNTLFGTLFAAFYTLLYRLSGQTDLVVGIPAAGQTLVDSNDLVGHCLNFLPTRSTVEGNAPFAEFATRIKKLVLDSYDHQNYTYGTLIQKLKLERDPSRLPLLSVMFNIDKRSLDKLSFSGLKAVVTTNAKQYVNFDLFVNLVQGDHDLDLECEFNTDLFDPSTVLRWLGHFETLMKSIVQNPKQSIDDLVLLTDEQRRQLVVEWNQTARPYPTGETMHGLFEAQVARTPNAIAVVHETQQWTYQELNRKANAVAQRLRSLGAKPGMYVGLYLERTADMIASMLGILKAGAAYVPLDPSYPQDRIAFYIQDSQAPIILTQSKGVSTLPPHQAQVVAVDELQVAGDLPNPSSGVQAQSIAYVIYTSGSTGKPKGVAIEHRNAANFIHWATETFSEAETSGVLAATSMCFDLSIFEIFGTLSRGGKIILAENALHLPRLAAKNQVTLINTVPSAIAELVQENAIPSSVQAINLAGEALSTTLVDRLYALPHVQRVRDLYGPSETTTYSTWILRKAGEPASIGRPIANTEIYLVDAKMQPTPLGVPGELLIGGKGVAWGYLNRPELTAEKFISDPFSGRSGSRLYRTGDLARYRADGNLEFIGRRDHQVKFRGFRIELGEIESVLKSHPAVQDCAVMVREDQPNQKRIVAYTTLRAGDGASEPDAHTLELGAQRQQQWERTFSTALSEVKDKAGGIQNLDAVITNWSGLENSSAHTQEWIDRTVDRLRELKPRRIFEAGCGTGQLLLRLAPEAELYYGTDFAKPAVERLEEEVRQRAWKQVKLACRTAEDVGSFPEKGFDLFILHSVAQYFPDSDYLLKVIGNAIRLVEPGGYLFIGDVQSHALVDCLHAANQLKEAATDLTLGELRDRVRMKSGQETELMVDPEFFGALMSQMPSIHGVEVQLRRGVMRNESTQYHYDVILQVGGTRPAYPKLPVIDWQAEGMTLERLRDRLAQPGNPGWRIRNIPNGRLSQELSAWRKLQSASASDRVDAFRSALQSESSTHGVDPDALWQLGDQLGWFTEVRWEADGTSGTLEAHFLTKSSGRRGLGLGLETPTGGWQPLRDYANNPSRNLLRSKVPDLLKGFAQDKLPDYMMPSSIVVLDILPRTPNGKVDRKALPAPMAGSTSAVQAFVAPRNEQEKLLAQIWQQVLGIPQVSVMDSFFDLGGDSHLIFRVANRASQQGLSLTPRMFFQHKTIANLVKAAESEGGRETKPAAPSITRASRDSLRRRLPESQGK